MKYTVVATAAFIVGASALAQPHGHQHQKHHEKRDIVWLTTTEVVTETIPITTTVWVSPAESAEVSSSVGSPGEFYQTVEGNADPSIPTTSAKSTTQSTSSTPQPPASSVPAPVVAPAVVAQPQTSSTTPIAVVVTPTPTPTPSPTPTPTPTSSAAPNVANDQPSSGYSGACASTTPCTGDITFYTAGLGACGDVSDGDKQRVVALPHGLMGTQSNGNPFCNMTITIQKNGKSTTAVVVDKCMGCEGDSIDLSNLAFSDLADFSVGRTTATWWFN